MSGLLNRLFEECRRRHIRAALVFFPERLQVEPRTHEPANNPGVASGVRTRRAWLTGETELQKRLRTLAARGGVPMLDLTAAFREAESRGLRLTFPLDGHWNPEGNRLVAKWIGDWLAQAEVFPFLKQPSASAYSR